MKRGSVQKLLLGSIAATAMMFAAGAANAVDFKFGEATLSVDNTASVGVGVRTSKQQCYNVSIYNGGCGFANGSATGVEFGVNDDDGNVNTDQWDPYSTAIKLTTDFELKYRNYGAFVRTKLFYDHWIYEEIGTRNNRFGARPMVDAARGDDARNFGGRGADILDAFVYTNFDVGNTPVSLRAGKQVINWGESLFIQGGISSYLPVDVSALRTPGSELKEAYLPVPALYASVGLPNNIQLEGFWQFGWEKTKLDACGTFFSGTDAACEGGQYVMSAAEYNTGSGITIRRQASDEGDDTGTFGLAFKHYADWLGEGTDLGLYFVRQSLTAPVGTFTLNDMVNATTGNAGLDAALAASGGNVNNFCNIVAGAPIDFATCNSTFVAPGVSIFQAGFGAAAGTKRYLTQYVNDVDSFGFSFNTTVPLLGGSALSGELNYTPDMPFALNDVNINCHDLNAAGVGDYIAGLPVGSNLVDACQAGAVAPTGPGATIQGYQFEKSLTGQVGMISTLSASDPMVALTGGDLMVLIFNAGFQYIPSLDNATNRYAVPRSASVNPNPIANAVLGNAGCQVPGSCVPQYADSFSSGYRIATSVDYNNAFGTAWTLSPSIQWAHDVTGYSAGPVGPGFVEGRKTVSVGVTANLRGVWRANLQYTNSFGNAYRNFGADKDFVTATVSYAF
jgi:hypothetical protein